MADATISAPLIYNWDDNALTGVSHGENVAINEGGYLVINSDTAWGPHGKMLGTVSPLRGTLLVDGRTVRSIPFTGNTGPLPPLRSILTGLTSNVTGEVIYTGHRKNFITQSGELKVRSLSGPMSPNEQFASASFTGYVSGVDKVGWLFHPWEIGNSHISTSLGTMAFSGEWYDLGVSNGLPNQVFRHYIDEPAAAVWVESGVGTNNFIQFLNMGEFMRSGWFASGYLVGNVFWQETGSYNINFGDGITGEIPVSGARLRVPNVQFAKTHLQFWTETGGYRVYDPSQLNVNGWQTNGGIHIKWDKVCPNGFLLSLNPATSIELKNIGVFDAINIGPANSRCYISGFGMATYTGNRSNFLIGISSLNCPFEVYDSSFSYWIHPKVTLVGVNNLIGFTDILSSGYFKNVKFSALRHNFTAGLNAPSLLRTKNMTFENCYLLGGVQASVQYSTDTKFLKTTFCNSLSGQNTPFSSSIAPNVLAASIGNDRFYWSGFNIYNFPPTRYSMFQFATSYNGTFTDMGSPQNFIDFKLLPSGFFNQNGIAGNTRIQRCYFSGVTGQVFINNLTNTFYCNVGTATDMLVQNLYMVDSAPISLYSSAPRNSIFRGCYFENSQNIYFSVQPFGGATNLDTCFGDFFFNRGSGYICFAAGETVNNTGYYTGNGGAASSNGLLTFDNGYLGSGTYWDITWPYYIKGYTGFKGINLNPASFLTYYQIDKNSGVFSDWYNLTGNLPNEIVDPTEGFKLKVRVQSRLGNALVQLGNFAITGLTNWEIITGVGSLYPADSKIANLTINNIITGSEIRVYRASNNESLAGVETIDTNSFSYSYLWEGIDIPINIAIMSLGYVPIRYENQILGKEGLSLYVQQKLDRVYDNPA